MTKWPDKVGVLISCLLLYALFASPFMIFRANRIVQGEARTIFEALPAMAAALLVAIILIAAFIAFCGNSLKNGIFSRCVMVIARLSR